MPSRPSNVPSSADNPSIQQQEDRPGRRKVARILAKTPVLRAKAAALLNCLEWTRSAATPADGPSRDRWRCKVPLCEDCARARKLDMLDRYHKHVQNTARMIAEENPDYPYRFRVVTLTVPRPHKQYWRGAEAVGYRREIAVDSFAQFRRKIDWFKRPPAQVGTHTSPWSSTRPRSSLGDSFAIAGWHISVPAPHLHILVYGEDYIDDAGIARVWQECYESAYNAVKARWRKTRPGSQLGNFIPYARVQQVDVKPVAEPLDTNLYGILQYLVDDGLSDEEMAADPHGAAILLTVWHGKNLITPYGRIRQRRSDSAAR